MDKIISTDTDHYWEGIDKDRVHHTDELTIRNKHCKDDDHRGYAINIRYFDIEGSLKLYHIMKNGSESLQVLGLNKGLSENDSYIDIEVKHGKTIAIYGTYILSFTIDTFSLINVKILDILSKNQDTIPPKILE